MMDYIIEPGCPMNFLSALEALEQGKKIRSLTWTGNTYWYVKNGVLYNSNGQSVDDWVEVTQESLSDKGFVTDGLTFYREKHVKEAIQEFLKWLNERFGRWVKEEMMDKKAKEIFGERLC